jgi:hypothetical protein
MSTPAVSLSHLSVDSYTDVKRLAAEMVMDQNPQPDPAEYNPRHFSKYPPLLIGAMIVGLLVVWFTSTLISGGKMMVSADLTLAPVLRDTERLSHAWLDSVVALSLVFGEVGTALFSFAATVFPGNAIMLRGREVRIAQIIFRASAIICAVLVVAANVGVSAMHMKDFSSVSLFAWLLTVLPPSAAIVLSLVAEQMVLTILDERWKAEKDYKAAESAWRGIQRKPENAEGYREIFYTLVLEALRANPRNKATINDILENNPAYAQQIVEQEIRRFNWAKNVVEYAPVGGSVPVNPTLPLTPMEPGAAGFTLAG